MFRLFSGSIRMVTAILAMVIFIAVAGQAYAQELVVYSGRHYTDAIMEEFTKKTGIKLTFHRGGSVELFNRMIEEGNRTPADLLITVDAGTLERARIAGALQPIASETINRNVPAKLRAPDNSWVGLTVRTRVIAYNPGLVTPEEVALLSTYEALTLPQFRGRIGIRTGTNVYPQSHTAMMIAEKGEAETEKFLRVIVANAGDKIYPSDTRAVEAVAKGEVDVALVNHYYVYGHLRKTPDDSKTLAFVTPTKTAYNVSGGGILKTSKNKEAAQKLIEFMASDVGQRMFAEENREYPVNPKISAHESMRNRDTFTLSPVSLSTMGRYMVPVIDLIDKVGYK